MKKKRSKRSRIRGRRSCGMGARNNLRGKGSYGGKGMAGTGKRAGQKHTWVLKYAPNYFGKKGFSSLKKLKKEKEQREINLDEIKEKLEYFIERGIAK
ncbi:MAG: 50S ribosomal protein L15, partial [Candidatus Nanoarchaeia archaeon]